GGANPADGNTITLSDGTTSKTFEFDDNSAVSRSNISVAIASDPYVTMANLIVAITAASSFNVSAISDGRPDGGVIATLAQDGNDFELIAEGNDAVLAYLPAARAVVEPVSQAKANLNTTLDPLGSGRLIRERDPSHGLLPHAIAAFRIASLDG